MLERFGEEYREYMKRTGKVIQKKIFRIVLLAVTILLLLLQNDWEGF